MVVVLPTPLTPTTRMTYGRWSEGMSQSSFSPVLFSVRRAAISSRIMPLSSFVEIYLSRATRSSIRLMIFNVVSTPISDVIRASSRLSSTSSSTVDLPVMARAILSNTLCLVFSSPLSRISFLFLLKSPNIPICDF